MGRVLNPIVSESYMRKYVEEHGGGGGSSITPILSLTLTSNSAQYNTTMPAIVNGHALESVLLSAGETADVLVLGQTSNDLPTFFGYIVGNKSEEVTYEITNLVNCTLVENESIVGLQITDPSQNASATLYYMQTLS